LKALFPGTFDPVTNGHLDLIHRASNLMNEVIVGVYKSPNKSPLFDAEQRLDMVCNSISHVDNVSAVIYDGLTVDFARKIGAKAIVRGMRALSDFEYEFAIASMNRAIEVGVETVFFVTSQEHSFISSSLIKEVAALGQNVDLWVPINVSEQLRGKLELRDPSTGE